MRYAPQRGTFVRRIVISEVTGARFVREAIEADVIKLLASETVLGLVEELRAQLRRQMSVAERKEPYSRFVELDDTFHRTLATAARQNYAWEIVENVKAQMDRVRHLSALRFPMEKLISQHEAIVDAIEAQDVRAAEAAIRGHLREILNDLPVVAQSRPEFFGE
ncbi:GntR family transcriptional regulator [Roseibium salinum]|nr:GntR family transcriptional regulator [Roseibium salinum]